MKKLLFLSLLLLVSSLSFGQIKIEPKQVGWPEKTATDLMVRVLPFETDATTCGLYWELKTEDGEVLSKANIYLTTDEFRDWKQDNHYLEDLVLFKLLLTRKIEENED